LSDRSRSGAWALAPWLVLAAATGGAPPARALGAAQLAVVINVADPLSVAIGDYYVQARHIPQRNVARVAFGYHRTIIGAAEFAALKAAIDAQLPPDIQAYALTWARPYRAECMSITAAFAFGFDTRYCATGCQLTRLSRYFDSDSPLPYGELGVRPAMSLAAATLSEAKSLIDRGVRSDGTAPPGTAYLLYGGDPARDVRAMGYADAAMLARQRVRIAILNARELQNRPDVMFYFLGATRVSGLETIHFLPGAVADHLTSYGGKLTDSSQMSSLQWLEAGATASYGTVLEPCNFVTKFPSPALLMRRYLAGETVIEAYWKSVAMPGQGVFIGEPLAAPYRAARPP
jgi:uncharacterized protein (TIGR03790 family)